MAKAADRARDVWVVLVADAPGEVRRGGPMDVGLGE